MPELSTFSGLSPDAKVVEFHTHSNMSDGSDAPEKVARRASRAGIRAVSLTDHDTVAGLPRAAAEAEKLGMETTLPNSRIASYAMRLPN